MSKLWANSAAGLLTDRARLPRASRTGPRFACLLGRFQSAATSMGYPPGFRSRLLRPASRGLGVEGQQRSWGERREDVQKSELLANPWATKRRRASCRFMPSRVRRGRLGFPPPSPPNCPNPERLARRPAPWRTTAHLRRLQSPDLPESRVTPLLQPPRRWEIVRKELIIPD